MTVVLQSLFFVYRSALIGGGIAWASLWGRHRPECQPEERA
jgi:hypothetical protein